MEEKNLHTAPGESSVASADGFFLWKPFTLHFSLALLAFFWGFQYQ